MIRGISVDGAVLIGINRESLERLLRGDTVTSPVFGGLGPEVVLVFAETDKELIKRASQNLAPGAQVLDMRRS